MIFEYGSAPRGQQPKPLPYFVPVGYQRYDLMTDSNGNLYLQDAVTWTSQPDPRAKRWDPIGPVEL
ncbi:hypothetical protein [Nakamurella lactea]|uniref:hypothetical protein n=1 Tax=Nakamurella lactea TaxID=459515 RepID=UPI0003FBB96A|nr:hypothetical protein [Nakamurella lactea]